MRRALLLLSVLLSLPLVAQARSGIRIEPNTPTPGVPVRIVLTENLCRDEPFTIARNESIITISYEAGESCVLMPQRVTTFDIGPLPLGNYDVRVVASNRPTAAPVFTRAFAVVQSSVPTLDEAALFALFAVLALLALRRL